MGDIKGQLSLFDLIEEPKSMLERFSFKVNNPVCACVNCLCKYCANNVESLDIKQGEQVVPCFNCDYCIYYSGEIEMRSMVKENCYDFIISEYTVQKNRNKLRIAGGKDVYKMSEVR